MAQYPKSRPEQIALVSATIAGIAANPLVFPSGPGQKYNTATLIARNTTATTTGSDKVAKEGLFALAVDADEAAMDSLNLEEQRLLAQALADYGQSAPENLDLLGYGAPQAPTFNPPGQVRAFEATVQGPGAVDLDWKAPIKTEGTGKVSFYKITRRIKTLAGQVTEDWGVWQHSVTPSEASLTGLDRGVEIDFQVVAVNNNGVGMPSNVVTVVL